MQRPRIAFLCFALLLAGSINATAEPLTYKVKAIHGQVVDNDTGAPLEGVIIVAEWPLIREVPAMGQTFYRSGYADHLHFVEVLSDKDGRYVIPGWSKSRPFFSHMNRHAPNVVYFKAGYYPREEVNPDLHDEDMNKEIVARLDGQNIGLQKFTGQPVKFPDPLYGPVKSDGSLQRYADLIGNMQITLGWGSENDEWKLMPHMIVALDQEKRRVIRLAPNGKERYGIQSLESLDGQGGAQVREFLKGLEK